MQFPPPEHALGAMHWNPLPPLQLLAKGSVNIEQGGARAMQGMQGMQRIQW